MPFSVQHAIGYHSYMQGVNLGGWLVPEQWITPSLFNGGATSHRKIQAHFERFITPQDIAWLAAHGINAVRIPVPYTGAFAFLDPIVAAAHEHDMHVLIDLHTAPGSQNGWDHSGGAGEPMWHTDPANIAVTLDAVEEIAQHYAGDTLWGIAVLNEPRWDVPNDILVDYYKRAYHRIRKHCPQTVVVVSDAFRPHDWQGVFTRDEFKNIMLDMHLYQAFSPEDKALDIAGHVHKVRVEWAQLIARQDIPVIVGEWSLGLDETDTWAIKQYGQAQLQTFSKAAGWFYWTYKTEAADNWNFRHCLESGLLNI